MNLPSRIPVSFYLEMVVYYLIIIIRRIKMACRLAKIEDKLLINIQKLKIQVYEHTGRTVTVSGIIQMLYDQDPLILNLIKNQH